MKIVNFIGGLGNQMFQYSFYLALKKSFREVSADLTEFKNYPLHYGYELEKIFNIKLATSSDFELNLYTSKNRSWIWRKIRRILNTKNTYSKEQSEFSFDNSIFSDSKHRYYWGYWQNIEYINISSNELKHDFSFPEVEDNANKSLIEQLKHNTTVSLHVRRGDYLKEPLFHGICDTQYYKKAISHIQQQVNSPIFVIFSNDIPWCRENFKNINAIFVDWNIGTNSFRDMQLMSLCTHNIIANSSFSWWGAWLNKNPDKIVIAPKTWINSSLNEQAVNGLLLKSFIKI